MSNPIRCPQGHFYDPEKYAQCPHCGGATAGAPAGVTVPMTPPAGGMPMGANAPILTPNTPPVFGGETVSIGMATAGFAEKEDERTMAFYDTSKGFEKDVNPVVGWLVCTKGVHRGEAYKLVVGQNFIGRDPNANTIGLEGEKSVSRQKHAVVVYEPRGNMFLALPGDSQQLCYINDNVVLSQTVVKKNDRLQLGEVELMLIPCCDEAFRWDSAPAVAD